MPTQKYLREAPGAIEGKTSMTAIDDIFAERKRQIEAEGWTPEHDDKHTSGELAMAAAMYAMPGYGRGLMFNIGDTVLDRLWPWERKWWKPKDRRRNLVKAGALIVAEIDRMDRFTNQVT